MSGIEAGAAGAAFGGKFHTANLRTLQFKDNAEEKQPGAKQAEEKMLGGGLEPPCLAAYAPQTYVSAISPPERVWRSEDRGW